MQEGTHLHIGLIKAWELWWQGKDINGDGDVLWGIHLIWWSRIGVITGVLGGLIIVLDIIGEERLKEYGVKRWNEGSHRGRKGRWYHSGIAWNATSTVTAVLLAWYALFHSLVAVLLLPLLGVTAGRISVRVVGAALAALKEGRVMNYARYFALVMLILSAHFTLLTS